ncbi:MAG: SGNH/GDSL hydrolase family protein [Lachnospiraceae bacterium]|nr:SGNH/GDSL hydrolase family protein [Lachnospiraceae bacterium]
MDDRNKMRKGKQNGSVLLLIVLIGFCILAIIEIIYGQAQIRVERERLALEEENHQTVQELKAEWNQLKGDPSVGSESAEEAGGEQSSIADAEKTEKTLTNTKADSSAQDQSSVSDNSLQTVAMPTEDEHQYDMQIVFLGDSIIDSDRENGGVAALISGSCNAKVYNMAMGGTTAALLPGEDADFPTWDSRSLMGVVNAILGNVDGSFLDGYRAGEILKECDFSKTDYFVIEYGVNDFTSGKIYQSKYLEGGGELAVDDLHTYSGALSAAVDQLRAAFPDAGILIVAPHYCQFYNGETFIGDAYSLNYGYGTLVEFSRTAGYVAEQRKEDHVFFYNAMEESGIDAYTADKYLKDGVHLTAEGRVAYAEYASRLIKADFYPEE